MGWFRRRADAAAAGTGDPDEAVGPGPGSGAGRATTPALDDAPRAPEPTNAPTMERPGWLSTPPPTLTVQRAITTLSPARFEAQLASWKSPSQLRPLAHSVSADAPAGILHDLPTAIAAPVAAAPTDAPVAGPVAGGAGPTIQRFAPAPGSWGPPTITASPSSPSSPSSSSSTSIPSSPSMPSSPAAPAPADASLDPAPLDAVPRDLAPDDPTGAAPPAAAAGTAPAAASPDTEHDVPVAPEPITVARLAAPSAPMPVVAPDILQLPVVSRLADDRSGGPTTAFAAAEPGAREPGIAEPGAPTSPVIEEGSSTDEVAPTLGIDLAGPADPAAPIGPSAPASIDPPPPGLGLPLVARARDPDQPEPTPEVAPTRPTIGPPTTAIEPPSAVPTVQRSAADASAATPSMPASGPPMGLGLPVAPNRGMTPAGPTGSTPGVGPQASAPGPGEPVHEIPVADHEVEVPTLGVQRLLDAPAEGGTAEPLAPVLDAPPGTALVVPSPLTSSAPVIPMPVPSAAALDSGPLLARAPAPARPLRSAPPAPVAISRSAVDAPGSGTRAPAPLALPVAPLVGERAPLSVQQLPDTAPTAFDEPVQPRSEPTVVTPVFAPPALPSAFAAGPTGSPRASGVIAAPVAPGAASVPLQRLTAPRSSSSSSSGPGSGPGAAGGFPVPGPRPSAGDIAVAAGLGSWSADGSVVFAPPPDEDPSSASGSPAEVIQRSADALTTMPGSESGPVPTTVTVVSSEPTVQLAPATGGGAAGGGGGSETELDELAKRLYGRMRQQLRRELILDRERSGSLIDMPR